jgi:hypothetical protein
MPQLNNQDRAKRIPNETKIEKIGKFVIRTEKIHLTAPVLKENNDENFTKHHDIRKIILTNDDNSTNYKDIYNKQKQFEKQTVFIYSHFRHCYLSSGSWFL